MDKKIEVISDDTELFMREEKYQSNLSEIKEKCYYDLEFYDFYKYGIFEFSNKEVEVRNFNVIEAEYNNDKVLFLDYIFNNKINNECKIKKIYKLKNLLAFKKFYDYYKQEISNNKLLIDDNKYKMLVEYIKKYGIEEHNSVPELMARK